MNKYIFDIQFKTIRMEISGGKKIALVCGGTGLIGSHLIRCLVDHSAYAKVVHVGRGAPQLESPHFLHVPVDFNHFGSYAPQLKGNDLFICLGTTIAKAGSKEEFIKVDYTYSMNVAKAALDNGVNQVILVSSVGAHANSWVFYNKVKGELERDLSALNFWAVHIFQPSILLGERLDSRPGESVAKFIGKGLDVILGERLNKYRPIEAGVVAKAMVNAAQKLTPGIHKYPSHQIYHMAKDEGITLTQKKSIN